MLKSCFWLLLIANIALLFSQLSSLSTASERHEPQRLGQQLHPEILTILPPDSAKLMAPASVPPPAVAPAPLPSSTESLAVSSPNPVLPAPVQAQKGMCVEVGGITKEEANKFQIQLADMIPALKVEQRDVPETIKYMVYLPSQGSRSGAEKKTEELRRMGIQDFYILPESGNNPSLFWGISLGIFTTEAAAKAFIQGQVISKGVTNAAIIARNSSVNKVVFRLSNLNAETKEQLVRLRSDFPHLALRDCIN